MHYTFCSYKICHEGQEGLVSFPIYMHNQLTNED